MKFCLSILSILCLTLSISKTNAMGSRNKRPDPKVVESIDLEKYVGFWYEIAHYPNFFQKNCLYSTAEYKIIDEQKISVLNTCYKKNNKVSDISGYAKIVNSNEPAKLKVRFNFFARGDYWVTHLDKDYRWAIVSGPEKESLFILSRTKKLESLELDQILKTLNEDGFQTSDLVYDIYE